MQRTLAARLAALEQARYRAVRQRWEALTEQERQAEIERLYGPGAWEWLDDYLDGITEAEGGLLEAECSGPPGPASERLWAAYLRWRETHS
jgi:hypothetical protein